MVVLTYGHLACCREGFPGNAVLQAVPQCGAYGLRAIPAAVVLRDQRGGVLFVASLPSGKVLPFCAQYVDMICVHLTSIESSVPVLLVNIRSVHAVAHAVG